MIGAKQLSQSLHHALLRALVRPDQILDRSAGLLLHQSGDTASAAQRAAKSVSARQLHQASAELAQLLIGRLWIFQNARDIGIDLGRGQSPLMATERPRP